LGPLITNISQQQLVAIEWQRNYMVNYLKIERLAELVQEQDDD
jgi:hypothetical protein